MRIIIYKLFLLIVVLALLAVACSPGSPDLPSAISISTADPDASPTLTPFQPELAGVTPQPSLTPSLEPNARLGVWIGSAVPESLRTLAAAQMAPAASPETAQVKLDLKVQDQSNTAQSEWVYALVAAFPTVKDGVSLEELETIWAGGSPGHTVLLDAPTLDAMKPVLGIPGPGAVRTVPLEGMTDALWQDRAALAIIPFEAIQPKIKVLEVDGQSPLRKSFDAGGYPLKAVFLLDTGAFEIPPSNRDPQKMTTVIMTGTTALVRAIAYKMEVNGIDYPALDIADTLREADILHITNEVSFVDNGCPYPEPASQRMVFCSDPRYIELLDFVGADVIELTGNHVNDWGADWLGKSVEMYNARGWGHFGGGSNLADATAPFLVEHNGNKLAFIGCNMAGPSGAWATDAMPGAAYCADYGWITAEIARLRAEGYQVITTLQYSEYYIPGPSETQVTDFARMAGAGATVVSGSQSHFPQSFVFQGDSFIHYGPGNLFFDQMDIPVLGTRRAFQDRYVFYEGRLLGVELLTTMLEDYSRPRPMTPEERDAFLQEYFSVSGW